MLKFFQENPNAGAGELAREQALENVRNNIFWMNSHKNNVEHWLDDEGDVPYSQFRLRRDLLPEHYDVELRPFLKEGVFDGNVNITVKVEKRSKYIVVHSHQLDVTKTTVLRVIESENAPLPVRSTFFITENQFWVTELEKPAPLGSTLILGYEFKGKMTEKLQGFYRSSYTRPDGTISYLATSQFQATSARQAFPCFDEPQFKSTFTITLVHSENMTAISNMPQDGDVINLNDTWSKTKFKKSVKMVTYLVCVIVSDFDYTSVLTNKGKEVRVYARPSEKEKTRYALNIGKKTLEFFEKHFKIDYPLEKLDMIAIPDFQAGAMENWGLVTYRETLLLYDELETSSYGQLRIDAVIGHELAHMWFGNLVTMKWWDDIWLNEGFASYMEYKSMAEINPTWEVDAQFFFEDTHRVLIPDASTSSHPIVQSANSADEISALFDAISYSKGASVLRMLEFFLGSETFNRGVTAYLNNFQYDNAVTADLWAFLERSALEIGINVNVTRIMDSWTRQMGYPYINVTNRLLQNGSSQYSAQPMRFLIDPLAQADNSSPYGYKWEIPLSYRTSEDSTPAIHWIPANRTASVVNVPTKKWTKFNSDSKCYYLVNYGEGWHSIIQQLLLDHKIMSASDRANLISDVFLLARGGLVPYEYALRLTTYMKDERHFVPWETARRSLSYLLRVLSHDKKADKMLKTYLDTISKDALASLGYEDKISQGHLERRLRGTLVEIACDSGNKDCLYQTGKMLTDWKDSGKIISTNLRLLVFRYGMHAVGNEQLWRHMWNQYLNESSSQMKRDYLHGLAFVNNSALIKELLTKAEDRTLIRDQDYFTALGYIAANPVGLPIVWEYVKANWGKLVERFTISDRYLGDMVKTICSYFTTEEQLQQMSEFFTEYPDAGAGARSRQEALQTVRNAIAWLKQHKEPVSTWFDEPWQNIRLTRNVVPVHYNIFLHPDLNKGTFYGSVSIEVNLLSDQRYLIVHSHMLNVTDARVTLGHGHGELGMPLELLTHFPHRVNEFWVLETRDILAPGNYTIHMAFNGTLLGGLVGFYRSSYVDTTTQQLKYLATSQFQSTYARRAFPCFDEPSFKSTFTVTLVHEENMTALSNMPTEGNPVPRTDGFFETKFEKSVPMVTYLVAVIVCDFDYTELNTSRGTLLRVYAPPDRVHQTNFSLDIGKRVLESFEEYFNISYPLPKLDMIALPDFRAGAMENWGLITYREIYLLFDKNETSPNVEFSIVMIIAHEIAHMWFGNLVTTEWWDDLWLNEGFATYMAHKCTDWVRPDMKAIDLFIMSEIAKVIEQDATWSSHPIVAVVNHPDEIQAIFDAISYSKGAAVLRKLEYFLTESVFQKGISGFLNEHRFGNAKTDMLWKSLTEAWNETGLQNDNVKDIMDTWTRQMGYPMVNISRVNTLFVANQQRFLLNPEDDQSSNHPSPFNYVWRIPLHYKTSAANGTQWLNSKSGSLTGVSTSTSPIKWNANQAGYYLVNYETNDWKDWAVQLTSGNPMLLSVDRSNLMSDAFLLAQAGYLNYDLALNLTGYLKDNEDDFLPWNTGKSNLLGILGLLKSNQTHADKMKKYLNDLSQPKFSSLSWNDSPDQFYHDRRLRVIIADLACRADNKECLENASQKLQQFLQVKERIPSAMRALTYRYGIRQNDGLWQDLWNVYKSSSSAEEKRDMMYGLAYSKIEKTLKDYLNLAKNASNVREQDFFTVLNNIAANPEGLKLAWEFYQNNWEFLVERYTLNDGSLGGAFRSITSHFTTQEELNQMEAFLDLYPDGGAGKADRQEALEIVKSQIKWSEKYQAGISDWLDAKGL